MTKKSKPIIQFQPSKEYEGIYTYIKGNPETDGFQLDVGKGSLEYTEMETVLCDDDCEYDQDPTDCDYCGVRDVASGISGGTVGVGMTLKEYKALFDEFYDPDDPVEFESETITDKVHKGEWRLPDGIDPNKPF